jgi:acyl-CoA thioester hydrolase
MSESPLGRWPVQLEIPVAWGDMDAFGHVNNTVFLRWCESARIAYFERTGMLEQMRQSGVGPILARATVDFRRPVVFPAKVRAHATISQIGTTSMVMNYRVELLPELERVADGESVIVMVDYKSGGKVPVDASLRERVQALEATGPG